MATISPSKAVITSVGGATGGGTSSSAQPVITGTATAGTYVNVYDGVRLIGTATVAANGTWSFTAPASLKGGTHSFTAIDVGSDGSYGTSSTPMSVIIPSGTPVVPPQPVINGMTDDQGHPLPNPTNDPHPSMNGTGTPGDTITMYDGNTPIGSTIVGPDGKWVVKPTTDLSNGTHDIYVIETNPAGVPSVPSDHTSVIIDTKVPATPAAPVLTDGSGNAIPAGSATSDGHPHISGTGGAGDKITVYDNGTVIGSTTVGPDGKWSYTPTTDLSNGTHSITVIDTNAAGTPSTPSTPIVIKIDTTTPATPAAPVLTDDSGNAIPAGSTTSDGHPHISGTGAVAGDTITVYDGATVLGTVTVAANGTWTFTPSKDLSAGSHSINVTETNAAGTASAHSANTAFTYSNIAPPPVITSIVDSVGPVQGNIPMNGYSDDPMPVFHGTGIPGNTVYLYDNGRGCGDTKVAADGTWTIKVNNFLDAGLNNMTTKQFASGQAQSAASNTWTFTLIKGVPATPAAPTLTDDSGHAIPAGSATSDAHPHISGTGGAGDKITVYDNGTVIGSTTVGPDGKWSYTPTTDLSNGTHSITVIDTNAAGAPSTPSTPIVIKIDTSEPLPPAAPTLTDDSGHAIPSGSTTSDGHPHISGTRSVAGNTITVWDGLTVLGTATVAANGTWTFTPSKDLSTGSHSIYVTETNLAGTTSGYSYSTDFTYSNIAPPPVITSIVDAVGPVQGNIPMNGTTDDPKPTFHGTGVVGDTVYLYDNGRVCGQSTVGVDGTWAITINNSLDMGLNNMTATQFASGQAQSPVSNTWTFTLVSGVPEMPAPPTLTDISGNAIPAGGTTFDTHPQLNGAGVAGDTITVYDGSTVLGTTVVGANGKWTFTPSLDLSSTTHSFNVTESNQSGTSAHSQSTSVTIQASIAPTAFVTNVTDQYGNTILPGQSVAGPIYVSGVVTGLVPGSEVRLMVQGDSQANLDSYLRLDVKTVFSNGTFSAVLTGNMVGYFGDRILPKTGSVVMYAYGDGPLGKSVSSPTYTVIQTNWSGTYSSPPRVESPPALTDGNNATIPPGSTTSYRMPHISGAGLAGSTVMVYDNGVLLGQTTVAGNNLWTFTPSQGLANGSHSITVVEQNAYGPSPKSPAYNITVGTLSAIALPQDDSAQTAQDVVPGTEHHTTVGEHDAFTGHIANGNETVDLNADPASYFKESTAHIQGSGGGAIDTLHLTGDHQVLDLTSLTGKTAAAKISGIEVIDLGGHSNTVKLSLTDVLNLGEQDLFQKDGHQQLMVKGADGDTVDLSNAHIAGVADGQWQAEGTAVVGGVTYNVYEHSGAHTELLVQQGVQVALHN